MDSWRCSTAAIPASADRQREMKESILDVLLYLFEHYFTDDSVPPPTGTSFLDRDQLANGPLLDELAQARFRPAEIHKAFDWLGALAAQRHAAGPARHTGPSHVFFGPDIAQPAAPSERAAGREERG